VCSGPAARVELPTLRVVSRRRAAAALLIAAALLGGCSSGGSESSSPSSASSPEPARRSALEVRPVLQLLAPGDPTVPAGADTVVESSAGNGLRYALGPAALAGPIVRRAQARDLGGTGRAWIVDIALTPSGTSRLEALGRRLATQDPPHNGAAVLVDGVMEGQLVFDPGAPVPRSIQLAGDLTGARARRLATSLSP
jgi:hypothetical protein